MQLRRTPETIARERGFSEVRRALKPETSDPLSYVVEAFSEIETQRLIVGSLLVSKDTYDFLSSTAYYRDEKTFWGAELVVVDDLPDRTVIAVPSSNYDADFVAVAEW